MQGTADGRSPGRRVTGTAVLAAWRTWVPPLALALLAASWGSHPGTAALVAIAALLVASVLAAVHHAEVVAHRVGEPFGSLVLAVAVTMIEVGLIVTLMVSKSGDTSTLARETVFAAAMIACNGIVGLSILVAAYHDRLASFRAEGSATVFATVITVATLSLVLPNFTEGGGNGEFSPTQLAFAAIVSAALYANFLVVQTIRHRSFFLPVGDEDEQSEPPSGRAAALSLGLLLVALVAVVGLAKTASPAIEDGVEAIGAPQAAVGVVIALLVLLPETLAALRNARRQRVQVSFNLAFGSALASIALTIPTIAVASIWLSGPLVLGLGATQIVLLALTALIGSLTLQPGRATPQQGALHLAIFAAFLFLAVHP